GEGADGVASLQLAERTLEFLRVRVRAGDIEEAVGRSAEGVFRRFVQCQVNLERLDVARLDVAHAIGKTLWQGGPGNHVGEYLLDVEVGDHRLPAQDFLAAVQ